MEIVKSSDVKAGAHSFLIIGVEKSGKTSFLASMAKSMKKSLIFACEGGTLERMGGIPNVDFVQCYVTPNDLKKSAEMPNVKTCSDQDKKAKELMKNAEGIVWRRFTDAYNEMLMCGHDYELGGIDSFNYLQDILLKRLEEVNNRSGYDLWRDAKKDTAKFAEHLINVFPYFATTVHVKTADDETVNKDMFTAALQGSYKDVIGGKYGAVFHSRTKTVGGKAQYYLQAMPDDMRKAGIRLPFGQEGKMVAELPNDWLKVKELIG